MRELEARLLNDELEEESGAFSAWMFNFVLGLLGATVLGLAFVELDVNEPRYLYNPWTYAIIVPIAMVMLSAVSSTLVSRIIRRSMQAAFLLSVLAHLLILTGFSNIIIHSRYWPQLFDSLAQQRQQLKKESLQAKQYVKVSLSTQPNARPDYLKHVPTDHQPTEVPRDQDRNLQLAKVDVQHLVTPKAELEKNNTAHLLKRTNSQATKPTYSPDQAKLSRSELSQPVPDSKRSPTYEIYQSEPALDASRTESSRSRTSSNNSSSAPVSPTNLEPQAPVESLASAANIERRSAPASSPSFDLPTAASMPRSNSDPSQPRASRNPVQAAAPGMEATQSLSVASLAENVNRSSRSESSLSMPLPSELTARDRSMAGSRSINRNQQPLQLPNPSDGITPAAMARSSAGGQTGPAARSSMPRIGDNFAMASAETGELSATIDSTRRSQTGRTATSLAQSPESGSAAGPQWDGSMRLSAGIAARTPVQLAGEGSGDANSTDPAAAMNGAGRDIQRASVGLVGPTGNLNVTTGQSGLESVGTPDLQSSGSSLARSNRNGRDVPMSSSIVGADGGGGSPSSAASSVANGSLPQGLQAKAGGSGTGGGAGQGESLEPGQVNIQRRGDLAGASPKSSRVNAPDLGVGQDAVPQQFSADLGSVQRNRGEPRSGRMQIPMEIDAASGSGGLANVPMNDSVAMLPRRSKDRMELSLPQFDSQRIMRSEVGGPLGAGKSVAKPAFQQRLDRLQNRDPNQSIDPQTELAIELGLEFLARYQRDDGSWRLQDFDTEVLIRSDTAATALALLAFQGAGYTHVESKYSMQVSRAISFLAKNQRETGDLYIPQNPASDQNGWLYSHAIASLALCEAYGMTQDESLRPIAQKAVNFMVSSQDPKRGGWRYRPESGSDTSVTGWYMMALQSAKLAGLEVPPTTFDAIKNYVERAQVSSEEPHLYRYNPFAPDTKDYSYGLRPTAVMTSVGLLIRLYLGWQRNDKQMMDGASYLLTHSPKNGSKEKSLRDTYYWYYATQVIFHMGGDYWKRWHDTLNPILIRDQVREGRYAGSWDPMKPVPDLWANYGGRLYVTTMNLLSLEVSYRHLPLYEATAK